MLCDDRLIRRRLQQKELRAPASLQAASLFDALHDVRCRQILEVVVRADPDHEHAGVTRGNDRS
jgi:hypothetical protein